VTGLRLPAGLLAALLLALGAGCDKGTSAPLPPAAQGPALAAPGGVADPVSPAAAPATAPARVSKGIAPQIGYTAPDFALKDLHGRTGRLSDYRGKVLLLNFWATWCGPCRVELPTIEALYEDLGGRDFEVVAVAGDYEGVDKVAPFMEQLQLTFRGLLDDTGKVQDQYFVNALPMTFVLDRDGVVVYKLVGFFDWNQPQFRNLVQGLLDEA